MDHELAKKNGGISRRAVIEIRETVDRLIEDGVKGQDVVVALLMILNEGVRTVCVEAA